MKNLLCLLVVLIVGAGLAFAGRALVGAPASVSFDFGGPTPWVDSGIAHHVRFQPSPVRGYSIMFVEFDDHTDEFHLDEGTVDIDLEH